MYVRCHNLIIVAGTEAEFILDHITERSDRGTLHLASAGTAGPQRKWVMKQARKTPGYTTDWAELVRC
jgi:hypothetical protein